MGRLITVYVSAPFELQDIARSVRSELERHGIAVCARWLDEQPGDPNTRADWARRDVQDIGQCDGLVLVNPRMWATQGTGGRHFECGVAFQQNKPIFIYGDRSNVFHDLPIVKIASNSLDRIADEIHNCWPDD